MCSHTHKYVYTYIYIHMYGCIYVIAAEIVTTVKSGVQVLTL